MNAPALLRCDACATVNNHRNDILGKTNTFQTKKTAVQKW
jgi:hypothetical protein